VAIVGLLEDVTAHCGSAFVREGDRIAVLGRTLGVLGGSEYLLAFHEKTAGLPPRLDAGQERALQSVVRRLIREGRLSSAHDSSEGGLAVTLAECCLMSDRPLGASVALEHGAVPLHAYLFGEDASRAVVSFAPGAEAAVVDACRAAGVPISVAGEVGGDVLEVKGAFKVPVRNLSAAWRGAIPAVVKAQRASSRT
jgi:phosphoribosylformylglycinamidine synthase